MDWEPTNKGGKEETYLWVLNKSMDMNSWKDKKHDAMTAGDTDAESSKRTFNPTDGCRTTTDLVNQLFILRNKLRDQY